jgi:hypothetical protein
MRGARGDADQDTGDESPSTRRTPAGSCRSYPLPGLPTGASRECQRHSPRCTRHGIQGTRQIQMARMARRRRHSGCYRMEAGLGRLERDER